MKTLKTKKLNFAICWNGLRKIPPREFKSVPELDITPEILEVLKKPIPEFIQVIQEEDDMRKQIAMGKVKDEEKASRELTSKQLKVQEEKGEEIVEAEFENEQFNNFFQQFERWGKLWFQTIEPYIEFRKDMNITNSQPKDEK